MSKRKRDGEGRGERREKEGGDRRRGGEESVGGGLISLECSCPFPQSKTSSPPWQTLEPNENNYYYSFQLVELIGHLGGDGVRCSSLAFVRLLLAKVSSPEDSEMDMQGS